MSFATKVNIRCGKLAKERLPAFLDLKINEIPIWENKHRIDYLTLFRDLIYDIRPVFGTQPRVPLLPTTGQPLDRAQLYTEFNERKALAQRMVALAEIGTRREYVSRLKGNVSVLTADALKQF